MFLRFALLLTVVIIAVQGEISLSTIEMDAAKLTKLYQQYTSHPGATQMLGSMRQTCPWLLECCPNELAHFTSLMFDNKFFGKCLGSAKLAGGSKCGKAPFPAPPQGQEGQGLDPQSRIAQHIVPWIKSTETACSTAELQSFYCEPNTVNKFQSCQVKTLQLIARENDEQSYESFVNLLEEDLTAFYDEVIAAKQ
jgi:hypothetical protein